ncbi:dienelactone hydrolase family protein [Planctomycetota bacterium]
MDQQIIDLYDEYTNGLLARRGFLKKLTKLAGGTSTALALLLLEDKHAQADTVSKDDPRLETGYIKYPGETGDIRAYSARPKDQAKFPGVIVIHENRGLQPHFEDVARRVALKGFIAIAPDALSPLGGTPNDIDKVGSLMGKLDSQATVKNFVAAAKYLKTHPQATGKVGCMGFCWGGGMTNQVAVHASDLNAAVPFYGRQPDTEDVPKIKASLLCHYAGLDERINAGIEEFEVALKEAGVDYGMYMHQGAEHAFFNNDKPDRYHKEAAELAWKLTIAFFDTKLKGNSS